MSNRIAAVVFTGLLGFISAAATAGPPSVLLVKPRADQVGMFEKAELIIELNAEFTNPFDPEEIDVYVDLKAPSGATRRVWGFYNPTTCDSLWMARFAPTEVGVWTFVVGVRDKNGQARSQPGTLTVTPSSHRGFIKVAGNRRYLQYDDGTSFYGIGL